MFCERFLAGWADQLAQFGLFSGPKPHVTAHKDVNSEWSVHCTSYAKWNHEMCGFLKTEEQKWKQKKKKHANKRLIVLWIAIEPQLRLQNSGRTSFLFIKVSLAMHNFPRSQGLAKALTLKHVQFYVIFPGKKKLREIILSSEGAERNSLPPMTVPDPSPVLDKIIHPWVHRFYPVLGLWSGGRLLWAFSHSSSVLDKFLSAKNI